MIKEISDEDRIKYIKKINKISGNKGGIYWGTEGGMGKWKPEYKEIVNNYIKNMKKFSVKIEFYTWDEIKNKDYFYDKVDKQYLLTFEKFKENFRLKTKKRKLDSVKDTKKMKITPKKVTKKMKITPKKVTKKMKITPKKVTKKMKITPKKVTEKMKITPKKVTEKMKITPKKVTETNNGINIKSILPWL
jgi:plasmid maintenance system antidote protein VapI